MGVNKIDGVTPSERVRGYDPVSCRVSYQESAARKAVEYRLDKAMGLRFHSGYKPLKKLTPRHKSVIMLYVQGMKIVDIAEMVGSDYSWLCCVLKDPLVQEYINAYLSSFDDELEALAARAVSAIRDGLNADDIGIRLKAVDRYAKMSSRYNKNTKDSGETAEDLIRRALEVAKEGVSLARDRAPDRARIINMKPMEG